MTTSADLSKLASVVSLSAPLLGSAISSVNPVAGILVSLIAHLFSAKPDSITDIIEKIGQDANSASKLKQLELDHQLAIYQAEVDDRKSAREREEQMVRITGHRDWLLDFIAMLVVFGYFIMCTFVIFGDINSQDQQILYMMMGQLTGGFIMVLSYYFGSSNKQ